MELLLPVLLYYYAQISSGNVSPELIRDYAIVESLVANVDPQLVISVIKNESGFNPKALNLNDMAKGCHSRGLVQIRNCNHKVTDEQAYNPIFAVNFLIKNIDKCKSWWRNTCFIPKSSPKASQRATEPIKSLLLDDS